MPPRTNVTDPPKEFTDLAIRMTRGSVGFFEHPWPPRRRGAAGADKALRTEFEAVNARVVQSTHNSSPGSTPI